MPTCPVKVQEWRRSPTLPLFAHANFFLGNILLDTTVDHTQGNPDLTQPSVSNRETEGLSWPHWAPGLLTVSPGFREGTHSKEEETNMKAGTWTEGLTEAFLYLTLPT